MAVDAVKDFKLGPLYTPPTLAVEGGTQGTIQRPAVIGGANWYGAAVDPETGLLYVPSANQFSVLNYLTPTEEQGANVRYVWTLSVQQGGGARPLMPRGLPLFKPPYSRMTAIDLNTGEHAWMVPNGNGDRIRNHPLLRDLNLPPLGGDGYGGPLLTKTLLISALTAGGEDGGPRLVARDKATGEEVASVDLPAGAIGTPMTYLHQGKQYIDPDGGRRGSGADRVRIAVMGCQRLLEGVYFLLAITAEVCHLYRRSWTWTIEEGLAWTTPYTAEVCNVRWRTRRRPSAFKESLT